MEKKMMVCLAVALLCILIPKQSFALFGKLFGEKITIRVVDEENIPIENAEVEIGFRHFHAKPYGKGLGTDVDYHPAIGKTDRNGIFSATDNTDPNVMINVIKVGFYKSYEGVPFNKEGDVAEEAIQITLKRKRNPVPMYAKRHTDWIEPPVIGEPVGYDLTVGDWVTPYGKGVTKDFIFTFEKEKDGSGARYRLTFSNEKDGIQEYFINYKEQSSYKWPFEAPKDGFLKSISKYKIYRDPNQSPDTDLKEDEKINYIFRVRSECDKDGNIIKACYGKIKGELDLTSTADIKFNYWFNPGYSTTLEFDTEKNLFIPEGAEKWKSEYQDYTGFEQ